MTYLQTHDQKDLEDNYWNFDNVASYVLQAAAHSEILIFFWRNY